MNFFFFFFILDPPEIAVETPVVFSGEGQEAMMVCIVHGEKPPEVFYITYIIKHFKYSFSFYFKCFCA